MPNPVAYVRGDAARLSPDEVTTEFDHSLEPSGTPSRVRSRGLCPRCHDETEQQDPLYSVANWTDLTSSAYDDLVRSLVRMGALEPKESFTQTMRCACREDHPGQEKEERGKAPG